jgi:hypothetical protein
MKYLSELEGGVKQGDPLSPFVLIVLLNHS